MLKLFGIVYQSPAKAMKEGDVFRQYTVLIHSRKGAYAEASTWVAGSAFIVSSDPKTLDEIKSEIGEGYRVSSSQVALELRNDR